MSKGIIYLGLLLFLMGCDKPLQNDQQNLTSNWQFTESGEEKWYPAQVPGSVQLDLLQNDLIPDPFFGTNEDSIQWVEQKNWTYRTRFMISKELLRYNHLDLVFKGLDTYAEVYLNDSLILIGENMFLEYHRDIRPLIKAGDNELKIQFYPPVDRAKELVNSLPYQLPSSENVKLKVRPVVRKAAYQFGWDFAPRIVTMGVWRPISLHAWNSLKIKKVHYKPTNISASLAVYEANITVESEVNGAYDLVINGQEFSTELTRGHNIIRREIRIENPVLWWPRGLGEPHLYDFTTSFFSHGQLVASDTTAIGVRTIELIQEEDSIGRSFRFTVNGRPIFIKGANWSPLSSYPGSIPDSLYRHRMEQVVKANMNMLRVWGGGIYESDLFYDLCDQYGILVWQDFMFANTIFPPIQEFCDQVEKEVRYQTDRLYNHPSLALWNGNNEIEVAWNNWGWQQQYGYKAEDSTALWQFYLSIFDELIPQVLLELDPKINYCPTSPLSNWGSLENFNHGSMHYWGVWHGQDSFADYRKYIGRFVSEYGFQSFPSIETVKGYTEFESLTFEDDKLLHQKSYVGTKKIIEEAGRLFGPSTDLADFINKSQMTQALAYKMAIESHRLAEKCAGTLFWQLNDCWPGPTWSVIDYKGVPKLAYDVVKDRYKSTIVVPNLQVNDLKIYIINEDEGLEQVQLRLEMLKHNGERVWTSAKAIQLGTNRKTLVYKSHKNKLLDGFTENQVKLKVVLSAGEEILDIEYLYFTDKGSDFSLLDLVGID
jgi:beta-mannosidase